MYFVGKAAIFHLLVIMGIAIFLYNSSVPKGSGSQILICVFLQELCWELVNLLDISPEFWNGAQDSAFLPTPV